MKKQGLISQTALLFVVLIPASANNIVSPLPKDLPVATAAIKAAPALPIKQTLSQEPSFSYAHEELWKYLRRGLNYLESPKPLDAPEEVSPRYVHPDGLGFGAYGFSPAAYEDVQRVYPYFRQYSWEQMLDSPRIYELANRAFADWMLKNLDAYIPQGASQKQVFDVLHQAWNLGMGGFKAGRNVVASRTRRAEEFKAVQ